MQRDSGEVQQAMRGQKQHSLVACAPLKTVCEASKGDLECAAAGNLPAIFASCTKEVS